MVCKICGISISRGSKKGFCRKCCKLGAMNPFYKQGAPFCKNCGKRLKYYLAKVCLDCYLKSVKNNSKKDNTFCSCGKKIKYSSKQCNSCRMKTFHLNNPEYMLKTNHWNWKNGLSRESYPKEFNRNKEIVRHRDTYICQNCSMTDEEHIVVYGSHIEVHHIDYNKNNNNLDNLLTLCKSCNVRANYNRAYWLKHYQTLVMTRT